MIWIEHRTRTTKRLEGYARARGLDLDIVDVEHGADGEIGYYLVLPEPEDVVCLGQTERVALKTLAVEAKRRNNLDL